MKYGFPALLIAAMFFGQEASAAPFKLDFQKADAQTVGVIRELLPEELAEADQYAKTPFGQESPFRILAARAKVSESKAPYLFVEITSYALCGNINCAIWGFEPTKNGWRKVFDGIGEDWTILSSTHHGHRDISELKHGGLGMDGKLVFRWTGGKYRPISK